MKRKYLFVHEDLCTGCRICESVCSVTNEKVINRKKSRIRIFRQDVLLLTPKVCDQCKARPCIAACTREAIQEKKGQVRVHRDACDGCGDCVKVCDKLFLSPENCYALMCNQCGACVIACPENALEMRTENDQH